MTPTQCPRCERAWPAGSNRCPVCHFRLPATRSGPVGDGGYRGAAPSPPVPSPSPAPVPSPVPAPSPAPPSRPPGATTPRPPAPPPRGDGSFAPPAPGAGSTAAGGPGVPGGASGRASGPAQVSQSLLGGVHVIGRVVEVQPPRFDTVNRELEGALGRFGLGLATAVPKAIMIVLGLLFSPLRWILGMGMGMGGRSAGMPPTPLQVPSTPFRCSAPTAPSSTACCGASSEAPGSTRAPTSRSGDDSPGLACCWPRRSVTWPPVRRCAAMSPRRRDTRWHEAC